MNVANLIMRLENDLRVPNPKWTMASWDTVRTWLDDRLQPDLRGLGKETDKVQRDVKLSNTGKRDKLHDLGLEFLRRFAWVKRDLADREATLARNRATLFDVPKPDDTRSVMEVYFRGREIREAWGAVEPSERPVLYLRAAETNDTETLYALQETPGAMTLPVIDDEIKTRAMTERAMRLYGEPGGLYETYQQNGLLFEYLNSWRDLLGAMFRDLGLPVETLGEVLGGRTHTSTLGPPDGSPPLQGNTWKQVVATAGV